MGKLTLDMAMSLDGFIAGPNIVYTDIFSDEEGNAVEGMPEMLITVEFTEHQGKTTLTTHAKFASIADLESILDMGMVEGLTGTWDRLEEYLVKA
jgi:uncharacterized protein YndB with AHSA1/START domain